MGKSKLKKRKVKHDNEEPREVSRQEPIALSEQLGKPERLVKAERNRAEAEAYRRRREAAKLGIAYDAIPKQQEESESQKRRATGNLTGNLGKSISTTTQRLSAINHTQKMREQARKANSSRHKKKAKRNYSLYYILILILVLVTGLTLSVTVFFNISQIEISGGSQYTEDDFSRLTGVETGDNLFRLNLDKMQSMILNNTSDLDSVKIERKLPETLRVTFVPSKPSAVVHANEKFYVISSGGRVIKIVDTAEEYEGLLQVTGIDLVDVGVGSFIDETEGYQTMVQLLASLEETGLGNVKGINVVASDLQVDIDHRLLLLLGNISDLDHKLKLTKESIRSAGDESIRGIFDSSVSGKSFFKAQTEEELNERLPGYSQIPQENAGDVPQEEEESGG